MNNNIKIISKNSKTLDMEGKKIKNSLFSDYFAPFSFNANRYGKLIEDKGDIKTYLYNDKFNIERQFKPVKDTEIYNTKVFNKSNNELITEFTDERVSNNEFNRKIQNYTLNIKGGKLNMFEATSQYKYIEAMMPDIINETDMNNFITYDIECYLDENSKFIPYAVAWYKAGEVHTYYSTDFNSYNDMIIKSFEDLLIKENKNCVVYIHNNKRFDSIFITNALILTGLTVKPLYKDDLAISMTVIKDYGTRNSLRITLKDSYLLLPSSLRDLCRDFQVETSKSIFPHSFASLSNLNYVGITPPIESFPSGSFNS